MSTTLQNIMLAKDCYTHRGICVNNMGSFLREEHHVCRKGSMTGRSRREEQLPSTQQ